MKSLILNTYRTLPPGLRRGIAGLLPIRRIRRRFFETDTSLHDQYYTDEYYETDIVGAARLSAPVITRFMMEHFRPSTVVDVGCGSGEYLAAFRELGVEGHGIELAEAGLRRCREKGLDVHRIDLTAVETLPWTADVVYSFEVAEHIPPESASRFVNAIATAARRHVAITAAAPGQEGVCHVNCQPKSYWIDLFRATGLDYDEAVTDRWEAANREAGLPGWFCENLLVFYKSQ